MPLRFFWGFIAVNALIVIPEWWMPYSQFAQPLLAVESLIIVSVCCLLPMVVTRWLAPGIALVVMIGLGLALSDLAMEWALGRSLNLAIDLPLAFSVEHLLRGALGQPLTIVVLLLGAGLVVAVWFGLARALRGLAQPGGHRGWQVLVGGSLLALGVGLSIPGATAISAYVDTPLSIRTNDQLQRMLATWAAREQFAEALAGDGSKAALRSDFSGLGQRDVIIGFVESYGVSYLHDRRYRERSQGTLDAMASALEAAGLGVVTTSLRSPVQGGQSWLAHASVLSGHWINDQIRYDLYLSAGAPSLIGDFERAGYQSVAVMPAITQAWPAGQRWGYDEIYDHARIDYAGPALNWVTMPDQYTWHFFQSQVRSVTQQPIFAELALISSHAPWTPILPRLDWAALSDGRLFQPWAEVGPAPAVLWSDQARIQHHYGRAVDYALRTAAEWAQRSLGDGLLILLGDHQAAPLITGEDASRAVPVHVISADQTLLAALRERDFVSGLMAPASDSGSLADLRGRLTRAFSALEPVSANQRAEPMASVAPSSVGNSEDNDGR
ncbi:MAG: hypothetical protein RI516_01285 [Spiribacter sp.]|nr:hypothetical protein [Spiribacter sp.]